MTARTKFCDEVLRHVGETVLMGQLDCSELVALGHLAAGIGDQTKTHTAQRYHDETRKLLDVEKPEPGDLGFYGAASDQVIHVVIYLAGGHVLSADGATRAVKTIEEARKKGAAVRLHQSPSYYKNAPFRGWHRNLFLDAKDNVTR